MLDCFHGFWRSSSKVVIKFGQKKDFMGTLRINFGLCYDCLLALPLHTLFAIFLVQVKMIDTLYSDISRTPQRSPNPRFLFVRIFLRIGGGQLGQSLTSPISRQPNRRNLENCRLTISNAILFSEFLVAPGGINGVARGSVNKGGFATLTPHAWQKAVDFGAPFGCTPTALQGEPPAPPLKV